MRPAQTKVVRRVPAPLHVRYQQLWGFSASVLTLIFAVYAIALLAALLFFRGASDEAGRRGHGRRDRAGR